MWFLNHLGNSAMSSVFIMAIVLTIFPSLISTRDNSVLQKVQATNVIEANNTVSSSSSTINGIVTKIVKVNDIEVAYKIFGRGEPLFLVPGFSMTMNMWDPIVLHMLSSNHTIIIFDNRGIGILLQVSKLYQYNNLPMIMLV